MRTPSYSGVSNSDALTATRKKTAQGERALQKCTCGSAGDSSGVGGVVGGDFGGSSAARKTQGRTRSSWAGSDFGGHRSTARNSYNGGRQPRGFSSALEEATNEQQQQQQRKGSKLICYEWDPAYLLTLAHGYDLVGHYGLVCSETLLPGPPAPPTLPVTAATGRAHHENNMNHCCSILSAPGSHSLLLHESSS